jgi:glutaredoxin-dependent peroxiredoxin
MSRTISVARPLGVGDRAPDFDLPRAGGGRFHLADAHRVGPVVVAFFPFAFTSTCTSEFCTFSADQPSWARAGAQIVGISCDSHYTLAAWARQEGISTPLASDFNKTVAQAYGVLYADYKGYGRAPKRSVFVIDGSGIIRYAWVSEDADIEPDYAAIKSALDKLS